MTRRIIGFFPDRVTATRAITELSAAGFDTVHLGVVMPDASAERDETTDQRQDDPTSEAAVGGSVIGGTAGALLVATGALVIPGIGPVIAGGILASLIGGTAGWLAGGLVAQGLSHEEAAEIEKRVRAGRLLVVVQAQGRDVEARQILRRAGAEGLEVHSSGRDKTTPYRRVEGDTAEGS